MVESLFGPWEGEAVMREIEGIVSARAKLPEWQTQPRMGNPIDQLETCIPAFVSGESCVMDTQEAVASVLSASVSIPVP